MPIRSALIGNTSSRMYPTVNTSHRLRISPEKRIGLVLTDVLRTELIGRALEKSREILDCLV